MAFAGQRILDGSIGFEHLHTKLTEHIDNNSCILDLLFRSRFTQRTLSEMIEARTSGKSTPVEMAGTEEFPEDANEP